MSEDTRIKILVVEDEAAIRNGLCDVLAFHGYQPTGVERGDDGLAEALSEEHAMVILDLMLPGMSGFDVCEKLRDALPKIPILILTARGSEKDILRGFQLGADDYVTKPFSIAELVARSEALLRRAGRLEPQPEPVAPFAFGPWQVNPIELRAERAGTDGVLGQGQGQGGDEHGRGEQAKGEVCELTRREVEVLVSLAGQPGRIVSRRSLLCEVWGYPDPDRVETRTVDMHIAKLRKKLDSSEHSLIETIRGEGYRYSG